MRRKRLAVILLVYVMVLSVLLMGVYWLTWRYPSPYLDQLAGAFAGAFFAFLFVRMGEWLTLLYRRINKHLDALVRLEHLLGGYLEDIASNRFEVSEIEQAFSPGPQSEQFRVSFNRLIPIAGDNTIILDLVNIDLINDLFDLHVLLRRLNHSIEHTNTMYGVIRDAGINKKIDPKSYSENARVYGQKVKQIGDFLASIEEDAVRLGAVVRLLSKNRGLFKRMIGILCETRYSKALLAALPGEIRRIREEIGSSATANNAQNI